MKRQFLIICISLTVIGLFVLMIAPKEGEKAMVEIVDAEIVDAPVDHVAPVELKNESKAPLVEQTVVEPTVLQTAERQVNQSSIDIKTNPKHSALGQFHINDKNQKTSFREKIELISKMGGQMSKDNFDEIVEYLRNDQNEKKDLEIKDRLMIALEEHYGVNADYTDALTDIVNDRSLDGDLRGYAVQHIRSSYEVVDDNHRSKLRESFEEFMSHLDSDVAGTTALAVTSLNKRYGGFDDAKIDKQLVKLLGKESLHIPNRITAMSLCAERGINVVDIAREELLNGEDYVLKVAALGVISQFGDETDIGAVEGILADNRLSIAHKTASKTLGFLKEK